MSDTFNIPLEMIADEKGYIDRECPNSECLYCFKINISDWKNKITNNKVHCPMCGHIDTTDKWWTELQLKEVKERVSAIIGNYLVDTFSNRFKELERSTQHNDFIQIHYKPGRKQSFANNPIGQRESWNLDITCPQCGTRYSVIGSAYFCPCCGYNSVESVLNESLDTINKMIESLPEMKGMLSKSYGSDKAETMCRSMLEGTLGDIISAFQKFAEVKYRNISKEKVRVNDFQIVEKGSNLFKSACSKGYDQWLTNSELDSMNILFQRRHLIEHNNGIVDQKYIDKSLDTTYLVGQRIIVREQDAYNLLVIIEKLYNGLKSI